MYHLNSKETCWMISFGLVKIPDKFYLPKKSAFVKISFERVDVTEEKRSERRKLIDSIVTKLQEGKETYQVIRDDLINDGCISFEKYNDNGIYYVSRSSLSNHIRTARKRLGLSYAYDKVKILEMFDAGSSREEIENAGFDKTNVYSVLLRNGRIERKYNKG